MGWIRRLLNSWRKKKPVESVVQATPVQHKPWAQNREPMPTRHPAAPPPPTPPWTRDRTYTPPVAHSAPVDRRDDTDYITPMVVASVLFSDSGSDNTRCDTPDYSPSSYGDSSSPCD